MKEFFINGLHSLYIKVLDSKPATFDEAQVKALEFERHIMQEKSKLLNSSPTPIPTLPPASKTPRLCSCGLNFTKGGNLLCTNCYRLSKGQTPQTSPPISKPSIPSPSSQPPIFHPSPFITPPVSSPSLPPKQPAGRGGAKPKKLPSIPYNPLSPPDFSLVPVAYLSINNSSTNPLEWDYTKLSSEKRCHCCAQVMQPNHPCQTTYVNYSAPEVRTLLFKNIPIPQRLTKPTGPPHQTP